MTDKPEKIDYAPIQQKVLEVELETHIKESEEPNRRNGKVSKTVKSTDGSSN